MYNLQVRTSRLSLSGQERAVVDQNKAMHLFSPGTAISKDCPRHDSVSFAENFAVRHSLGLQLGRMRMPISV